MATKDITDRQVLEAYRDRNRGTIPWPYELLVASTGQPEKVCYRACERSCRRGLIEYGVSLRSGWITESGHNLLTTKGKNNATKSCPQ